MSTLTNAAARIPSSPTQLSAPRAADGGISVYTFDPVGITVRATLGPDGAPWFVAADVAKALGYSNGRSAIGKHVSPSDRMTVAKSDSQTGTRGGARSLTIINESGLYALVLRSNKPRAAAFKQWVTGAVLPSIHRNGGYLAGEEALPQHLRDALHAECRAALRKLIGRVDDATWHDTFKPQREQRLARALSREAAHLGIPLEVAQRAYAGDAAGAEAALVAIKAARP